MIKSKVGLYKNFAFNRQQNKHHFNFLNKTTKKANIKDFMQYENISIVKPKTIPTIQHQY